MSKHREITITCPKCKKDHPFVIWERINTSLNPGMKEAVKDRSAFLFKCPSCGEKNYVNYGFLYHQMEDRIIIQYADSDEEATTAYQMLMMMFKDMQKDEYLIRIVRSQNELREKIAIFDAGLDDRIIEIFKINALAVFFKAHPDSKSVEILYFRKDNKNYIEVFTDGEYGGAAEIIDEDYEKICQEYAGKIPDIRKDKPFINRQWALHTMGLIK